MLDEIKPLLSIAKQIYDQVMLSKANQQQCQRLHHRIEIVMSALRGLETVPNNSNFQEGLQLLQKTLYDCLGYVRLYTNKGWFRRIIRAGTDSKKFVSLSEELGRSANLLQLGMVVQQILNREEDKADAKVDQKALLKNQGKILALAQAEYQQVKIVRHDLQGFREEAYHHRLEEAEEHLVMKQKLASIQGNLRVLLAKKKVKSLVRADLSVRFYELSIEALLKMGTMGKVYAGRYLEQPVAIKMIETQLSDVDRKAFAREVDVMSRLHSPYITQLYGACIEPGRACLVMEYMTRGSLYEAVPHFYGTSEEKHQMLLDLARGLYYLHQREVLHLDFNSKNVLLNASNQVKITDFGFSKIRSQSIDTLGGDRKAELAWTAPERFDRNASITEACDVYSFGVVLWELMTGRRPLEGLSDAALITQVTNNERDDIPEAVPTFYADLIRQCWMPLPKDRTPLIEIIHQLDSHQPELTLVQRLPSPTPEAYYQQGLEYEKVKRFPEAAHAYQRAVHKGNHTKANTNLASFFHRGVGEVERNKQEAYERYLQSAERGHARAQFNLAKMLEKGDGVPKNLEQAQHWYQEAEKNGNTRATESLSRLSMG